MYPIYFNICWPLLCLLSLCAVSVLSCHVSHLVLPSCQLSCLFRVFCLSIWNPVTGDMEVLVTSLTHGQYGNERALYSQRICSSGNVLLSDWPIGFHLPCGINNMWLPCLSLLLQSNSCLWWEWSACVLTFIPYTHQVTIRIYCKLDSFFHVHEVSSLFTGSLVMVVPGSYSCS